MLMLYYLMGATVAAVVALGLYVARIDRALDSVARADYIEQMMRVTRWKDIYCMVMVVIFASLVIGSIGLEIYSAATRPPCIIIYREDDGKAVCAM